MTPSALQPAVYGNSNSSDTYGNLLLLVNAQLAVRRLESKEQQQLVVMELNAPSPEAQFRMAPGLSPVFHILNTGDSNRDNGKTKTETTSLALTIAATNTLSIPIDQRSTAFSSPAPSPSSRYTSPPPLCLSLRLP
ncbi:hypothetical protein ColLi_09128 [Colletotrichum liriopes]|uniref:Uncharacterized protein n=1 Tax=Colletotrichum liriopes TaxID=708192 RepID=A0AA37LUW9_9PEZI|nr:hypothetical protein ColLi_09128 [Colletotrichum liriopes]